MTDQGAPRQDPDGGEPGARACPLCADTLDAAQVWQARRARTLATVVDESHFRVALCACTCGRASVHVFGERVDFAHGNDAQEWVLLGVTDDELEGLRAAPPQTIAAAVERLGAHRRHIVRGWDADDRVVARWVDGGLRIPSHD